MIPNINQRNLPKIQEQAGESLQERELLYKVLFDMKNDLNDLKSLIFELIRKNDLDVGDVNNLRQLQLGSGQKLEDVVPDKYMHHGERVMTEPNPSPYLNAGSSTDSDQPVIITDDEYDDSEVIEESYLWRIWRESLSGKHLKSIMVEEKMQQKN